MDIYQKTDSATTRPDTNLKDQPGGSGCTKGPCGALRSVIPVNQRLVYVKA